MGERIGRIDREGRFRLDTRKKVFTVGMVRHWNRMLREAVNASREGGIQDQARWGFEKPGREGGVPPYSRGLELDNLNSPIQPKVL